jgi:ketosteroid isomerase-like protein
VKQVIAALAMMLVYSPVAFANDSDRLIIEETYNAWLQATNAKDIEVWSSFLAPEAFFVPPGVHPLDTEVAIVNFYEELFADPNFSLDCRQLNVDVAMSGELAWARGICMAAFTDESGHKTNGTSRWFKIWLKQTDGSWKCRVNTWNYED